MSTLPEAGGSLPTFRHHLNKMARGTWVRLMANSVRLG